MTIKTVCAFYGFSGGGYNLRHILEHLAATEPQSLRRIELVVVIGAPFDDRKKVFVPARYNALVPRKAKGKDWKDADWDVVYRENPTKAQMPKGLEHVGTHMFGPDVLLAGWPERQVETPPFDARCDNGLILGHRARTRRSIMIWTEQRRWTFDRRLWSCATPSTPTISIAS